MNYYAALDVSLRSVQLCVGDEHGQIQAEGQADSAADAMDAFLRKLQLEITLVGLEAGTLTPDLTDGLREAGYSVVGMEARQVKVALSAMRNKPDKIDARGIAQRLRTGWYPPVYRKRIESPQIRALLASRNAVLKQCVDLENEIRGLFKVFGIKLPPKPGHGSFDTAVRETIEKDPALCHALRPLPEARRVRYHTFRELDNRTRHMAHQDPLCQRLMTAPGVGFVAAHFGLTPRRFQSGAMEYPGPISKAGDPDVRCTL